ncbi:MAG: hypothetical protein J6A03_13855 [Lachnospiraceae bacterium]|nr:hypothetical protein [Lachnospiraceae bacterium]
MDEIRRAKDEIDEKDKIIKRLNDKINLITVKDDKLINIKDNMVRTDRNTFAVQFRELFEDD